MKLAGPFREPISRALLPDYYTRIAHPISLRDMRENNAAYKYLTVEAFLTDMSLLVTNAATYNGPQSDFAKHAQKLRQRLETSLTHDRRHLGASGDSLNAMEEAIKTKFVYLKRAVIQHRHAAPATAAANAAAAAAAGGGVGGAAKPPLAPAPVAAAAAAAAAPVPFPSSSSSSSLAGTATDVAAPAAAPAPTMPMDVDAPGGV
jgi:hypothetical protein